MEKDVQYRVQLKTCPDGQWVFKTAKEHFTHDLKEAVSVFREWREKHSNRGSEWVTLSGTCTWRQLANTDTTEEEILAGMRREAQYRVSL